MCQSSMGQRPFPFQNKVRVKVLVADDLISVYSYLAESLADLDGIEMADVRLDAEEARKFAIRWQPDVLIMDIHMRGGPGAYILQAIKRARPATVVIVLTLFSSDDIRAATLGLGADFFFDKSTELEQVPVVLRNLKLGATACPPAVGFPTTRGHAW